MKQTNDAIILKKLMCLPYLTTSAAATVFRGIKIQCVTDNKYLNVIDYFEKNFFQNSVYLPENWCVFGNSIRSNNSTESWHSRLKKRCGKNCVFTKLLKKLHHEAKVTKLYSKLMSEKKIIRQYKKKNEYLQSEIFSIWESFQNGEITSNNVLEKVIDLLKY